MAKRNGPMKRKVVSLMCANIKKQRVDIDKMVEFDREKAIRYLHNEYLYAQRQINREEAESQSLLLEYSPSPENTST